MEDLLPESTTETKRVTKNNYEYKVKRFQFYDPTVKRMRIKNFNLAKMTEQQAEEKGRAWLEEMKKKTDDKKEKSIKELIPDCEFKLPRDKESGISICMIASTRAGKTTMLEHILDNYFDDHINVLFSNSLQAKAYDQIKKSCISSALYHPQIVKDMYKINKELKNKYEFLTILDDVVDEKHDKELMKLLTIYRNSRMSCIIAAQSPNIMNSIGRGNINFVLLGRLNSDETIEKVIKKYLLSYFPSDLKLQDKMKLYRELTEDYHFLMIDNINDSICRTKIEV